MENRTVHAEDDAGQSDVNAGDDATVSTDTQHLLERVAESDARFRESTKRFEEIAEDFQRTSSGTDR